MHGRFFATVQWKRLWLSVTAMCLSMATRKEIKGRTCRRAHVLSIVVCIHPKAPPMNMDGDHKMRKVALGCGGSR
jgi:hypothetical protein